ncbi:hypothetical protein [Virgisporangium ochraceum]|uniref:Uncharacterized protein n=1 Tax=Virgisporangium ochraceum TaxID=65505 RepID=A0A8J3ZJW9_9ACTN|nr:hypothetical protein [Virgisporangium ochraceum]GIJ65644.1 hypothetical protein Voc01_005610 [Virgisporangium ochraceum]
MTRIRALLRARVEAVADRIHAPGDARARAAGLTVERLPGGRRRMSDPRVPVWLERRRQRLARTGGDPLDRALATGAHRPRAEAHAANRDDVPRLA